MQKSSAARHRQCRDGRLVGAEVIGDVMYWREECLVQASISREKAQADPARYDYWIDQAVVWLQSLRRLMLGLHRRLTKRLAGRTPSAVLLRWD
jgi:hypothetical protein